MRPEGTGRGGTGAPADPPPSVAAEGAPPPGGSRGTAGGRNLKLVVEYEGTSYLGWQNQPARLPAGPLHPGGARRPERGPAGSTVQGELERAAARVVDHPVVIYGSGRTDRGVHALGQTANFHTTKSIPTPKLLLGINTYLPEDIRVRSVEDVPLDFHARYSARGKRYRYTFYRGAAEPVLLRRLCAAAPLPLDVEAMRRAAAALRGERDYRALEGAAKRSPPAPGAPPRSTVRTLAGVTVREEGPFLLIDALGRGFLYGMVRTIAGTLLEVGLGKRAPESMEKMLASLDRRRAGLTAPARGLCLVEVYYGEGQLEEALERARGGGLRGPASGAGEDLQPGRILKLFREC